MLFQWPGGVSVLALSAKNKATSLGCSVRVEPMAMRQAPRAEFGRRDFSSGIQRGCRLKPRTRPGAKSDHIQVGCAGCRVRLSENCSGQQWLKIQA